MVMGSAKYLKYHNESINTVRPQSSLRDGVVRDLFHYYQVNIFNSRQKRLHFEQSLQHEFTYCVALASFSSVQSWTLEQVHLAPIPETRSEHVCSRPYVASGSPR